MSLRALPLIVIAFIFYNVLVLFGGPDANETLKQVVLSIPAVRPSAAGALAKPLSFTKGDLIILVMMLCLFVELLKSTYASTTSLIDHALSMLVFVACLVEFLLVDRAFTSVFLLVTIATLIDVIAGYTIGVQVARRDLNIGSSN